MLRARTAQLEKALKVWKLEQAKPTEKRLSARNIAREYGIPVSTLNNHINKKHLLQTVYLESRQVLNAQQELKLVDVIHTLDKGVFRQAGMISNILQTTSSIADIDQGVKA